MNFLSVTFTYYEKLKMELKKVSSMEQVIAERGEEDTNSSYYS